MALSLLGSANLIRPGLRRNGSSHPASRHRHLGKGRVPGKRFAKQSVGRWVKRAAQGWRVSLGKAHVPAKRLRSNRWVGWVEKDSAGLGG